MKKINFREIDKPDYNLLCLSDTIGGALFHFKTLFEKIQMTPPAKSVLFQIENQLKKEDLKAFDNRQKSVEWIHNKLQKLLSSLHREKDHWDFRHTDSLLKFQTISLSSGGYLGDLMFELRHIASEVVKNKELHPVFDGFANIEQIGSHEFCISKFIFPDYVEQEISKPSLSDQIDQWKEQADISLSTLYRFLKILALYDSFVPLTFPADHSLYIPPKNLQELEQRHYQAYVGYYLSLFKSADTSKHPLSIIDLSKLMERFLYMLQKEISQPTLKGPALKKQMSAAAEQYCVSELVDIVRQLSPTKLNEFKQQRYGVEIFELLSQRAKNDRQPFADHITRTMVTERAGPTANRLLFIQHGIIWHPIPQK